MTKEQVLKEYFGYDVFREGQETLINAALAGRDVLGIMPTGSGKSLCYQVPALMMSGITLVISPLISLMNDQVRALNEAGVHAAYVNSSLSERIIDEVFRRIARGTYQIIYVAPERLETERFRRALEPLTISQIAVDEAHCVSQWGQDFRPSYLKICEFIGMFPKRPVVSAYTATATDLVRKDILSLLGLQNPEVVSTGFDRPNLFFDVRTPKNRLQSVIRYVKEHEKESGIIYCSTRKNVKKVYEKLSSEGISASRYHAGLAVEERQKNQDDFIYDKKQVMVATNAFGMGIDKSNVRYVIHYNMPQSLENYYQEAGRAGRDGEPSECILFYQGQDIVINRLLLSRQTDDVEESGEAVVGSHDEYRLQQMVRYVHTSDCYRGFILQYFGEEAEKRNCASCGNCTGEFKEEDCTDIAKQLINCIYETRQRYGITMIVDILRGSSRKAIREAGFDQIRTYGVLKECPKEKIIEVYEHLLYVGLLRNTQDRYQVIKLTDRIRELNDRPLMIKRRVVREEPKTSMRTGGTLRAEQVVLNEKGQKLFEALRTLRLSIAAEERVPPYIVFSDRTLRDMCARQPFSREEMLAVNGVGAHKFEKYGERFIQEIREFMGDERQVLAGESGQGEAGQKRPRLKEADKKEFQITPEAAGKFDYREACYLAELVEGLNELRDAGEVRRLYQKNIKERLISEGKCQEIHEKGKWDTVLTESGEEIGLQLDEVVSKAGNPYHVLVIPEAVQREIVEWYTK